MLFLMSWLLGYAGSAALFSIYPVLMQEVFGVPPGFSSLTFAVAAGLRLALYPLAGHWSMRSGAAEVLHVGLGARFLALCSMFALGIMPFDGQRWLALLAFTVVVLSWSLLSVSGTALTAHLSPVGEGEGMGMFNAVSALAGALGAGLGGWLAAQWGYNASSGLATIGVALGLFLALTIKPARKASQEID